MALGLDNEDEAGEGPHRATPPPYHTTVTPLEPHSGRTEVHDEEVEYRETFVDEQGRRVGEEENTSRWEKEETEVEITTVGGEKKANDKVINQVGKVHTSSDS
ncbi:hypothetical protein TanjilG_03937 [Lupinus angustifolius]|uniref:Uncharacterized protein n=1 Tax=Lupinus angustifolius TaxID=3871 RepID=A0A394BRR2_LUPAN|nr:hypothetical protein TanjilG_03936 [Lupinus angustifolius]OIW01799.1 hypothetical protein TanjilG_03937 [Lupinus angustifolius]